MYILLHVLSTCVHVHVHVCTIYMYIVVAVPKQDSMSPARAMLLLSGHCNWILPTRWNYPQLFLLETLQAMPYLVGSNFTISSILLALCVWKVYVVIQTTYKPLYAALLLSDIRIYIYMYVRVLYTHTCTCIYSTCIFCFHGDVHVHNSYMCL